MTLSDKIKSLLQTIETAVINGYLSVPANVSGSPDGKSILVTFTVQKAGLTQGTTITEIHLKNSFSVDPLAISVVNIPVTANSLLFTIPFTIKEG